MAKFTFFVLTGEPGVGKTTLTKKLSSALGNKGFKATGFYTEEVRKSGQRAGFDIVTLNGTRGRLARDQALLITPSKHKVGKYGVLVKEFETIALPSIIKTEDPQSLLVIDEIGKMEFFSVQFKSAISNIFSKPSEFTVLATIPMWRGDELIESIRNHENAKVWTVTKQNRDIIHDEILEVIQKTLSVT